MIEKGGRIPDQTLSDIAAEISDQVDRASLIINRLREFGKRVDLNPERADVNQAIRDVLAIMEHQFALQKTELITELVEDLPPVAAQGNRLKQVFFILLANAWEAMDGKKGTPAEDHPNTLRIRTFLKGDQVWITISDTGVGMSENEKHRAFEPFFTTKEAGRGRGLGLAIAIGIMRDYGGKIHLESEKWAGTTLKLAFPRPAFS
jgi:histidine kinase